MVCLYHLDDDGKCAAGIVNKLGILDNFGMKFFEMNYGFVIPYNEIQKNEVVYIVDFSITPEEMRELLKITCNVTWIDHHVSAIEKYEGFEVGLSGIRSTKYSGCMLTYLYLTRQTHLLEKDPKELSRDENIPLIVRFCDDYDMWRFNLADTKDFHQGFAIVNKEPNSPIWFKNTPEMLMNIIQTGKAVKQYRANMMEAIIKSYGYESTFEGYSCYVLNQGIISSEDFNSIDTTKYDILVGWIYSGDEKWHYQLRSKEDGPDVRAIAEKYGGGGHIHAAGFTADEKLM